jgi:hypothetical protein
MALLWLALAGMAIWGTVLVRGLLSSLDPVPYIPTARYAYPVIIPTLLLLVAGWSYWPGRRLARNQALRALRPLVFWLGFLSLDIAAVTTISVFYSGR